VVSGSRWALLPSAAGVIDPLLSTGFPLNLLGLHRLLDSLEAGDRLDDEAGRAYARHTLDELDATERLVGALYAAMDDFELFKRTSLLYFAAASFSETVRRLGRPEQAPGFLLHADPRFGPDLRACAEAVALRLQGAARAELLSRIDEAIAPYDVAGLGDRSREDRYPVRAEDLLAAAPRLGARPQELEALLERCGFQGVRGGPS
jgi:FADH2 O2-dependent halogenase